MSHIFVPAPHMVEPMCRWAEHLQRNDQGLPADKLAESMADLRVSVKHYGLESDPEVMEALAFAPVLPEAQAPMETAAPMETEAPTEVALEAKTSSSKALAPGKVSASLVAPSFSRGARMRKTVSRKKSF
jgi:hypothetical protein